LAIAARPRTGDWLKDEIEGWRSASVDVVVSLLEPQEVHELELAAESEICMQAGLAFTAFPIPDRGLPASLAKTRLLVASCHEQRKAGNNILVHCRAGIGRSSLIAACILVAAGLRADEAFERIATARGQPVPDTPAQTERVAAFTMR
jgi:protein-tyrosine phosphatase